LWVVPVDGGKSYNVTNSRFGERSGAFSPDGDWIAYVSNEAWNVRRGSVFTDRATDGTVASDSAPGPAGSHGRRVPFQVTVRDGSHPITKGLPPVWRSRRKAN
jgi:hypothetical protein